MAENARMAAAAALVQVHGGGWSNLAAKDALAQPSLSRRDRAFANALFYGTAERLLTLDFLLSPFLKRPVEKLDVEVRAILETGLYQVLYMRVPASAAVNEAVKLARAFGKSSAAGLVNAVLRKAAAAKLPQQFASEAERVRIVWSVGDAVEQAVREALEMQLEGGVPGAQQSARPAVTPKERNGFAAAVLGAAQAQASGSTAPRPQDTGETFSRTKIGAAQTELDAFFAASFAPKRLCLRVNTLKTDEHTLAEALRQSGAEVCPGAVAGALYAVLLEGVLGDALHAEGLYHVQGEASQYCCAALGAGPGMKVLDVCAAPGGKAATLAQLCRAPGARPGAGLTACDVREGRVELIRKSFARLGVTGAVVLQNDAAVYNESFAGQDRVLCDVPCSGLGVLGKKPELRYVSGENFKGLPALQLRILETSARYVKAGGRMVYSTCTVRREENEEVVRAFLSRNSGFKIMEQAGVPPGAVQQGGMVTLWPHRTGLDGFFVALFEKLW